jgi:predicted outer membrane repeat protein
MIFAMAMKMLIQGINVIILFSALMALTETSPSFNNMICTKADNVNFTNIEHSNDFPSPFPKIQNQSFLSPRKELYYCLSLEDILYFQHYFKSYSNICAIIQQGNHSPGSTNEGKLHIARHDSVSLVGNGTKENVVLTKISVILSEVKETNLSNFTADQSSIIVYGANDPYSRSIITVTNCTITNSRIILTDVVLLIKDCEFKRCKESVIVSYSSFIILEGVVVFSDNVGEIGGALSLRGSRIRVNKNTNVTFQNNSATLFGGAIFIDNADYYVSSEGYNSFCFYSIERVESDYSLIFIENFAERGGDHIYGASLNSSCTVAFRSDSCGGISESNCSWTSNDVRTRGSFMFYSRLNTQSLSPVSSNPTRVCLCNGNYQPSCVDLNQIFREVSICPGEYFNIPMVIVGGDFGTTIGTVQARYPIDSFQQCVNSHGDNHTMRQQVITQNKVCTQLTYCFYGNKSVSTLTLYLRANEEFTKQMLEPNFRQSINEAIENYDITNGDIKQVLLYTPIVLNITFLPCPPGFFLLDNPPRCDCHPCLGSIYCTLQNGKSYISWNSTRWISAKEDSDSEVVTNKRCPFSYCKSEKKNINLQRNPDAQCDFNRAGKLCGKCRDNYSLAIGSSRCIVCPNNNNLALIIFFAAVGPLLVLIISVFNLTVTQGTVNGLIFYANIVWAYQSVFFPSTTYIGRTYALRIILFKPFIAWLNLDFGIEACFYQGLDMFSKTWLQFIFPVYTATLFFIGLKFSSRFSKLFGNRSVPTLATLLALSLNKLLRTIIAGLQLAQIKTYSTSALKSTSMTLVWALDGNLEYGKFPHHGFLLFAVLACLVFLWIPYTLILFTMQWLRRIDHYRPLKLIAKFKPVYDAYFAPFKDNHHYWFGVLLLAQGALLLISSLLLSIYPNVSLLMLCSIIILMLCYLNFVRIYKKNITTIMESSFYVNLILLTAGMLHYEKETNEQEILLSLSIGIAFFTFCAIIAWNLISWILKKYCNKAERSLWLFQMGSIDMIKDESNTYDKGYIRYRDSVLN